MNIPETIPLLSHSTLIGAYVALFIGMLIEGPVLTAAGAFAAVLGYMNIYIVFTLSILGNLLPDGVYYIAGIWGRMALVEKYGHKFGLTEEKIKSLEKILHTHPGKALTIIKLLPVLATPGLILAGAARVPVKKYVFWSLVVTLPTSLFYLLIGYYFGASYKIIVHRLEYDFYFFGAAIIIFFLIYYGYKKLTKKLVERMETGI